MIRAKANHQSQTCGLPPEAAAARRAQAEAIFSQFVVALARTCARRDIEEAMVARRLRRADDPTPAALDGQGRASDGAAPTGTRRAPARKPTSRSLSVTGKR